MQLGGGGGDMKMKNDKMPPKYAVANEILSKLVPSYHFLTKYKDRRRKMKLQK